MMMLNITVGLFSSLMPNISRCFNIGRNTVGRKYISFQSATKKSLSCSKRLSLIASKPLNQKIEQRYFSGTQIPHENAQSSFKDEESTHFGNKTVSKEEKAEKVHDVFENVADKYDLMNDVMSAGIHRIWKDKFVHRLSPTVGMKLLDVAGGTGDITFRVLQSLQYQIQQHTEVRSTNDGSSPLSNFDQDLYDKDDPTEQSRTVDGSKVTVCDISEKMLAVGRERAANLGFTNVDWVCGDAQCLPFPESSFDAYTIAYGMRNVVDIDKALQEAYRVLKPGGRFLCLEFSQVENSLIKSVYDLYSFQIIPVMGQVVAADWHSYQYLVESIRKFPDQETYKSMIEAVGFRMVTFENLTFGVTAIHSGFKI